MKNKYLITCMSITTEHWWQQFHRYEIERDEIKSIKDIEDIEDYIYYKELDKSVDEAVVAWLELITGNTLSTKWTKRFRLDKVIISDIKKFPI